MINIQMFTIVVTLLCAPSIFSTFLFLFNKLKLRFIREVLIFLYAEENRNVRIITGNFITDLKL